MSLQSWKEEFYSPEVGTQEYKETVLTERDVVLHSLRKWIGLLPYNLESHGVIHEVIHGCDIVMEENDDEEYVEINDSSCSLCFTYSKPFNSCKLCPLSKVRDDLPCYIDRENDPAPYYNGDEGVAINPEIMISWLVYLM